MSPKDLMRLKLLPIFLVTFPKLNIKTLLLEISYTEIIELEGTMHSTKREKHLTQL